MLGCEKDELRGVIPRALEHVVRAATALQGDGWEHKLAMSIVEIYNEDVIDLGRRQAEGEARPLELWQDASGRTQLRGATQTRFATAEKALLRVERAVKKRSVGPTAMNLASSRSHLVITVDIQLSHAATGAQRNGKLHLVDLAGNEVVEKSKAQGARLKEAKSINYGLSCLGDVFTAIKGRASYVSL